MPDASRPATADVNGTADARAAGAVPVLPLAEDVDLAAPDVRREALAALERAAGCCCCRRASRWTPPNAS